ncbi:hypothetical protein M569_03305 [Genlisea aurea]|uniref:Chalcone isomerase domain-containing protein n=1 Tax=Genlisea aurea TaxID=192259 RepID=S8EFQ5_9LAMI|nr:hypothetical protein M569_03305 [Genlisea aurea]
MVSFNLPFCSPPKTPPFNAGDSAASRSTSAAAVAVSVSSAVAAGVGSAIWRNSGAVFPLRLFNFSASRGAWCSLSASANPSPATVSGTDTAFPPVLNESQRLLGVGVRRKAILGLKNIDVYSFGVYADDKDLKKVLVGKTDPRNDDIIDSNVSITIRLQIVYGRLNIGSVRSGFEESVGSRIRKFNGSDDKQLLHRFTSLFKDEYKIPKGSIIHLSRDNAHVLRTSIDGVDIGAIESKLLCKSILDLYIGNEPFDRKAKEDVQNNLASLRGN